ncbi:MAG: DUF1971 domain-containing protein [Allosphingosinicella sp.]
MSAPYKWTPEFDATTLPEGLKRVHSTKEGTWGVIHVSEGSLRLVFPETGEEAILAPGRPGLVEPAEPHLVEPLGPFRMRIAFHREAPAIRSARAARAAPSG